LIGFSRFLSILFAWGVNSYDSARLILRAAGLPTRRAEVKAMRLRLRALASWRV
jgi:hypothetical protein